MIPQVQPHTLVWFLNRQTNTKDFGEVLQVRGNGLEYWIQPHDGTAPVKRYLSDISENWGVDPMEKLIRSDDVIWQKYWASTEEIKQCMKALL